MVDDDPVQQLVLSRLVEACGAEAVVTGDGRSALEAASTFEFDLVLIDVQMPGMSGTEVTRSLRGRTNGATSPLVPVIGVTGEDLDVHLARLVSCGMDDAVAKPLRRDALEHLLGRWIRPRPTVGAGSLSRAHAH